MANGIAAAVNLGANVINISYGSFFNIYAVEAAIRNLALPNNVLVICSVGNDNGEILYPARYSSEGNVYPYENGYPNVIAVGATNQFDERSNYSNFGYALNVVAPGGNGGTFDEDDIFSTLPNYSVPNLPLNYGYANGTSMAAPFVTGIAALVVSVNPALTAGQVRDIIQQTADDKGATGRDDYFGWGRVNANQAVLLALAYANKSTNYYAGYNNAHLIERGYSGKLHEVFHSGGEIFYRRSSNNGTSWEITKRLSSGNGANGAPSIVAGYSDVLCTVWQNKIDSRHYNIMYSFSSNMGTSWTTPATVPGCSNLWISYYQSPDYYGPGPTPVVASYFRGGSEGTASFLLVYAAENGLHYKLADSYSAGWRIPANDIVPGSYGSSSQIWFPSLASYNSQDLRVNLVYGVRFGSPNQIYSQIFNDDYPDGSWSSRVAADWVGTYNRYPSLALDYVNSTLGVWSGWNDSKYSIRFRQGFANGSWSSWTKEWLISGYDSFSPVLTYYNKGGSYPYGIDILWHTSANQIRQKKYYGIGDNWTPADPNTQLLASNGLFANITHERQNTTVPRQTWTDQSTSPTYSILYNSSYLPKVELLAGGEIRRAAEIADSANNSHLRIELSQPVIKLSNGESKIIPFKEFDYTAKLSLSLSNVFDYLQTEPLYIPGDAESISYNLEVKSSLPDTLVDGSVNKNIETPFNDISFELFAMDNTSKVELISTASQSLNSSSGIYNFIHRYTFNSQSLKGKEIYLLPKVNLSGSFNPDNLRFGLVNVSIEELSSLVKDSTIISSTNQLPSDYYLDQNYPNPFNPTTSINFSLPRNEFVTLKIFDILGREVAILVKEEKTAGSYTFNFDASKLSSGIYFYSITTGNFHQTKKMILAK